MNILDAIFSIFPRNMRHAFAPIRMPRIPKIRPVRPKVRPGDGRIETWNARSVWVRLDDGNLIKRCARHGWHGVV